MPLRPCPCPYYGGPAPSRFGSNKRRTSATALQENFLLVWKHREPRYVRAHFHWTVNFGAEDKRVRRFCAHCYVRKEYQAKLTDLQNQHELEMKEAAPRIEELRNVLSMYKSAGANNESESPEVW